MKTSEKIQLRALLKKLCEDKEKTGACIPGTCGTCHITAIISELPASSKKNG